MAAKDGTAQNDVKSLFTSYNGHLNFYKDAIQDGYQKLLYKCKLYEKGGNKMVAKDGIT